MKRNFFKTSIREKADKSEKNIIVPAASRKEKRPKKRLSIYDDFDEEEMEDYDPKSFKPMKTKR